MRVFYFGRLMLPDQNRFKTFQTENRGTQWLEPADSDRMISW